MPGRASSGQMWLSFQTQLLISEIGAIVLSGFAVNCLSEIPEHSERVLTVPDVATWFVAAFLPAAWSALGAVACISYGSHLREKRATIQQWTQTISVWEMLGKALPEVGTGDRRIVSAYMANSQRMDELQQFQKTVMENAGYEERAIERRDRGTELIFPCLALIVALAIRMAWSYDWI